MFSEYASRFLAQSQSRLSAFGQPTNDDNNGTGNNGLGANNDAGGRRQQHDWSSSSRNATRGFGRSFLGRGFSSTSGNPYQQQQGSGSRFGQLNFASRYGGGGTAQDAPLFQSRADINEEDEGDEDEDEMERDREAADLYALQRSRRVFAASRLDESSGTENDRSRASLGESGEGEATSGSGGRRSGGRRDEGFTTGETKGRGGGIHSSWNGNRSFFRQTNVEDGAENKGKRKAPATSSRLRDHNDEDDGESEAGNGKMEDIGLESTFEEDDDPPLDLTVESPHGDDGDHPPAFQKFHGSSTYGLRRDSNSASEMGLLQREADLSVHDPVSSSVLQRAAEENALASDGELFRHDPFFAWLYLIALASLFATFALVYLHTTSSSDNKKKWGDTIYTTLLSSFHLLAVDTLVSVVVSLVWLAALRSYAKHMVGLLIVAVPVILLSFTIYPFVSSYQGGGSNSGSSRVQDLVMRWMSLIPGILAVTWLYLVWKSRNALQRSIEILEFSSRILAANSALVLVGMGCLVLIVFWTWAWLAMFTRVFLGGSFSSKLSRFIISASSWWLGIYFVLMYMWTLSVISGVQRATTGATVSQWYFHRNVQPAPSSSEVVAAALNHAMTTIFGSICLSTLMALGVRLPLLVLPRKLANGLGMFFYSFVPASIATLTNPLTLTYAAIHSQNLSTSSHSLSTLDFLSPQAPTTTLTPRAFQGRRRYGSSAPLLGYRLAKLLLHATRLIMATALGFAGWVITARQLRIALPDGGTSHTVRGSAYAYVVGLVASLIGWGVLGAMEGILSGILDAVVICYGSETRMASGGGGYCMEAAYLFGGRLDTGRRDDDYQSRIY